MAELKISQLPVYTAAEANDDDVMPIVDQVSGVTKKISLFELDQRWRSLPTGGTINQVLAKVSSVDGAVTWLTLSKTLIGLGQVNNTADIDKPLSQAAIDALNTKASTASVAAKADKTYVDTQLATKITEPGSGTNGQLLTLVAGVPTWQDPSGGNSTVKYWGDPSTDGSWRQRVTGTTFLVEFRRLGAWVTYSSFDSNDIP
jgi:hypothetical protein